MDRQLTIESQGEQFHLRFHNYFGPQEGHNFGALLGLEEVDPPADDSERYDHLVPGQYFMWHPMGYHPNLHAQVTRDHLMAVSELVRDFHVRVLEGEDFLPEPPPKKFLAPHGPNGEEIDYIELIEREHQPPWAKGPKALIGAFLFRAIPLVVVLSILLVASRHFGDHRQELSVDSVFARAETAPATQGFVANLITPDHSREVRTRIGSVRYAEDGDIILADGNYLRLHGVSDALGLFRRAAGQGKIPTFDADLIDGQIAVRQVVAGSEILATNIRLERLAKLPPSGGKPPRASSPAEGQFVELADVGYADTDLLESLRGQRISLMGRLDMEEDQLVLRQDNGTGVVLTVRADNGRVNALFGAFIGSGRELQVDMILQAIYPMTDRRDATRSRQSTRLIGEARAASASARNYHATPL